MMNSLFQNKNDILSQSVMLPQTGPKPPQKTILNKSFNQQMNQKDAMPPSEFLYEYDMDENGALFFLGSFGKKRIWQNPHKIGQVQAFASSIGAGN